METKNTSQPQPQTHVLVFPFPAQGHVNSMLKLSELLSFSGLKVTFLNTDHIHHRLLRFTAVQSRLAKYSGFEFKTITDGLDLPVDQPRSSDVLMDLFKSMDTVTRLELKEMLIRSEPPVTFIIGDGVLGFVLDVGDEVGIPVFQFRTISACCFWAYFCLPDVIEANELPIRGNEDMDRVIQKVPGMENFLRCRDLPSFCRTNNMEDPGLLNIIKQTRKTTQAQALILNTFEDLEGPILSQIRKHCPTTYTIGPLHALFKEKLNSNSNSNSDWDSNSIYAVDRSCIQWLDSQPPNSVIYVSFGSFTVMTREQLLEIWYGLANSKQSFLWVIRPDSIIKEDKDNIPKELVEATKQKGLIVDWVSQEEVLQHKAIGGFLTHNGWNSTLESIVEAVPMICWPYFADQQVNSRFVSEIWGLGLDMKDVCDRKIVEEMVNDLMVERREEFVKSTSQMAKLAWKSVSEGGSSWSNLDILIHDINSMSKHNHS